MLPGEYLVKLVLNLTGRSPEGLHAPLLWVLDAPGRPLRSPVPLPDALVEALAVARDLYCEELDLDGDDGVVLGVVVGRVQPEQGTQAVVLNLLHRGVYRGYGDTGGIYIKLY